YIFEYSAGPLRDVAGTSFWTHLRSFGPEFFMLGAIAVFLCNVSVPTASISGAIPANSTGANKANTEIAVTHSHIVAGFVRARRTVSSLSELTKIGAN